MKSKLTKKRMLIGSIALISILLILGIVLMINRAREKNLVETEKAKIIYNNNPGVIEEKEAKGLSFTNIKCYFDGKVSTLTYTLTNTTDQSIYLDAYDIVLKNEKGTVLTTISPNFARELKSHESFETSNYVAINLTEAMTLELNLEKKESEEA